MPSILPLPVVSPPTPLSSHPRSPQVRGLLLALIVFGALLSIASVGRGWINPEAEGFIPHYLSGESLPALIFNPTATDWDNFQGRELSYVFDWLDCQFILACTRAGFPHFLSLTHLGLVAAIAIMLFGLARRGCGLSAPAALGLVAVWVTSPAAILGANFYRSAKITSAAALILMLVAAWRYRGTRTGFITVAIAGLAAALCDRQGFALLLFFAVWTAWRAFGWKDHAARALAIAAGVAVVLAQCYTALIGPALIAHYTGQPPNASFMHLSAEAFVQQPGLAKAVFLYAPLNALQSLGFQSGNLPAVLLGAAWLAASIWLPFRRDETVPLRTRSHAALWWLAALAAMVVLNMGMAWRQANVVSLADFKRIYFPLPATACFFVLIPIALQAGIARGWFRPPVAAWGLFILALSNVVSLPGHRLAYSTGAYTPEIAAGPAHIAALHAPGDPADSSPAVQAIRARAWAEPLLPSPARSK